MRQAFISELTALARLDRRIVLLTADLGYGVMEEFRKEHSDRFYNVGVAEQNMVGIATGLAEAGLIPYVYSIVPFAVLRPFEFIRNGPIQHQLKVRIIGVGGGFAYGHNGLSHYGIEDVGVMRTQPGIAVIAPADEAQARTAMRATWDLPCPVYYRLGKDNAPLVEGLHARFESGRLQTVCDGGELLIVAMGGIAAEAVGAARLLKAQGLNPTVAVCASFAPAPLDDLERLLGKHSYVMTVEAHYANGGLGSLVAEVIAERGIRTRLHRAAVRWMPVRRTGSERFMNHAHGLTAEPLAAAARKFILS